MVGCICTRRANYMRIRPKCYHDAKTDKQLRNRAKMKAVMAFLSAAKEFVNHTMDDGVSMGSATNLATKVNFHRVEVDESFEGRPRYGELVLSEGSLLGLDSALLLRDGEGLRLRWETMVSNEVSGPSDRVSVMVYNETRHKSEVMLDVTGRGVGECVLRIPERWLEERLHVYVAVGDEEGERFSDSQYFLYSGEVRSGSSGSESMGRVTNFSIEGADGKKFGQGQSAFKDLSARYSGWGKNGVGEGPEGVEKGVETARRGSEEVLRGGKSGGKRAKETPPE